MFLQRQQAIQRGWPFSSQPRSKAFGRNIAPARCSHLDLEFVRSNGEAANFVSVWYSPPFGDDCGKVSPEKMLYRITAPQSITASASFAEISISRKIKGGFVRI
jgi:hypothetical protein